MFSVSFLEGLCDTRCDASVSDTCCNRWNEVTFLHLNSSLTPSLLHFILPQQQPSVFYFSPSLNERNQTSSSPAETLISLEPGCKIPSRRQTRLKRLGNNEAAVSSERLPARKQARDDRLQPP